MGFYLAAMSTATAACSSADSLRMFADCAGRLSAQMEYQWLMRDPSSEQTAAQRAAMLELVEAIMTPDQGRDVLAWRIGAKQAHAVLLTRATFNDDANDAAWALDRAETQLAACTGLLLS